MNIMLLIATSLLPQATRFGADVPPGTGLEWMTVASVLLPALLLIVLAYVGWQDTV